MKLVIVTGLSGSGKSIALHCLEDLGYYCIDNLPVRLLRTFAAWLLKEREADYHLTAIGIDARNAPEDLQTIPSLIRELRDQNIACEIVFLDARDDVLIRRFSETRRKHPLTRRDLSLSDAIQLERALLVPALGSADLHIDTTDTNVHQLQHLIRSRLSPSPGGQVSLMFQSFGFKHSVPPDSDFVFDVRCLPNPYWRTDLRALSGQNPKVVGFLESHPEVRSMRQDLIDFLDRWIPRFEADGRSYLTVAIGCTGGQHRSVYLADQLSSHFRSGQRSVLTRHRELSA